MPRTKKEPVFDLGVEAEQIAPAAGPGAFGTSYTEQDRKPEAGMKDDRFVTFSLRFTPEFEERVRRAMRRTNHARRADFIRAVLDQWLSERNL